MGSGARTGGHGVHARTEKVGLLNGLNRLHWLEVLSRLKGDNRFYWLRSGGDGTRGRRGGRRSLEVVEVIIYKGALA